MGKLVKDTLYLSTNRFMYKRLYHTGVAGYIVLLIFSVLFYKERIISPDTSFYIYHILKAQTFRIELLRFGDIFNQWPAVLSIKAGLPLNFVMMGFSAGYAIYYFTCYIICGSLLKKYDYALAILMVNILFVAHTFYWVPNQLAQGITLLIVVLAYASNKQHDAIKPQAWLLMIAALITTVFYHPLVISVMVYAALFLGERRELFVSKKLLYIIAGIFCVIVFAKPLLFHNMYEQHALGGLKNFATKFPDYFTLYSNKRFIANCLTKYFWLPILFIAGTILYSLTRQWRKLFLFIIFFTGYLLLVNVCFPTSATPAFYVEALYMPLSIMIAFPFIFDLLLLLDKRKLALPLIALIIISGCTRIYTSHNMYTTRLHYERQYITKYDGQKVILKATQEDMDVLQLLWSNPYEFLLLSASDGNKPASILIDENPERLGWAREKKKHLIVNSDIVPYTDLPAQYFRFTDTVNGYEIIETPKP